MRTIAGRIPKPRVPKAGRPTGTFTQHRRIDRLRELLESEPRGLTLEEIASTLRVTRRSVRRYLRELDGTREGDRFELLESVEVSPGGAHRWRIRPSERGRAIPLRRAQAYAILAARRQLEVLRGSALFDEVDLALGQIEKLAQTPFRAQGRAEIAGDRNLDARFFCLPPASRSYVSRGEDLDELFRAVADLRVLRYRPRTRGSGPRNERVTFLPYALVVHDGAIVVLGATRRARAEGGDDPISVVTFDHMTEVRTSETEHFELPANFDLADYVHGHFGIGQPATQRFMVEFDARVADEIKSRKLHPQQRMATSPDGRVRLSLPLVEPAAVLAWILSWGDAVRVVDPPELAAQVSDTLTRAAARYGGRA